MFKGIKKFLVLAALLLAVPLVTGTYDSWSGHAEKTFTFSAAVTSGTSQAIAACPATTGVAWNVRSIVITDTVSGVVTLYSDSTVSAGNVIGQWGVLANTPLKLNEDDLRQGVITTLGKGLYLSGATGTITVTGTARLDPVSPR